VAGWSAACSWAITDAETLSNLSLCSVSSCGPLLPDAVAATKNKVPGVPAETLAWLGYCVENTKKALLQKSIRDLAPVLAEVSDLDPVWSAGPSRR